MSSTEFHKLAKDAKLEHPKLVSQAQLDILFTRVNRGDEPDKLDPKIRDNELEPREFISLLLRISALRFGVDLKRVAAHSSASASAGKGGEREDGGGRMSLARVFERLMVEKLLPHAATADDQEVKTVMGDKKMLKILDALEEEMKMVFAHYSRGATAKGRDSSTMMDLKEFTTLLQHINVMGGRLVRSDLDIILGSVQIDENADEANFEEFVEMLLVVSMHLNPNPYIPVTKRFMLFLKTQLFPGAVQRVPGIKLGKLERKYALIAKKSAPEESALGESESGDSDNEK